TGNWIATGTSGDNLILARSGSSGIWSINPAAWDVNYVTVSNSTNLAEAPINPATWTKGEENTNWSTALPTDVVLDTPTTSGFTAQWSEPIQNGNGYKVYVSTTANADCSLATYPGTASYTINSVATLSQVVTDKSQNSQYCVAVKETSSTGDSALAYSNPLYTLGDTPSEPTSAPVNNSLNFTNPYSGNIAVADDTREWTFRALVTDDDGPTSLDYVEIHLANSSDNTEPYDSLKYRWTQASNTFSEVADTQDSASISSTSGDSNAIGNQWTLDFKIKFNNNFLSTDTNYAIELYSVNNAVSPKYDLDNYPNKYSINLLSLSLSLDSPTLAFGYILPNTVITGTTIASVTTNYPNGYSLTIGDATSGNGSALVHQTDHVTRIVDYVSTIAAPTTWTGTGLGVCLYSATGKDQNKWGTGVSASDSNNKYAGVPQNATTIFIKSGSSTSADETHIGYRLVVPNTQKTGDYSGDIIYSATGALQ
ncbi:MAG: hypothetical protein WCO23_00975, partial [bacterium]